MISYYKDLTNEWGKQAFILNVMKTIAVVIFSLWLINNSIFSQGKLEVDIGAGYFEAVSLKIKYGSKFQFGVCQGFFTGSPIWLTGVEGYYHFSGESKYTEQPTFYAMAGLSSTLFSNSYGRFEKIFIYPRIGRAINFSERFGANIDIGIGLFLDKDIKDSDGYLPMLTPSFGIHLFVRI